MDHETPPAEQVRRPADFDRLVLVFSDVEMGPGGPEDDFPHSGFLGRILLSYLEPPMDRYPVDVIFNGDTFDLLKTPYLGGHPHHINRTVALAKMSSVAAAHPLFFDAVRRFVEHGSGTKAVHFVLGNHDLELAFPEVQSFIHALCGTPERVRFPGFELTLGPILAEHGSQWDPLFRVDPDKVFVEHEGETLLNVSWATVALLDVIIPLRPLLHFHDRLVPKTRVMELVPEIRDLIIRLSWRYWTRDFWRDYLRSKDPVLKLNWSMFKEIVKRFTTTSPDVQLETGWLSRSVEKRPQSCFILGHLHRMASYYHHGKRVLQVGALRDEYLLAHDGKQFFPILKPYYELYVKDDRVVGVVTRELLGPPRPEGEVPASIFDVVPLVKQKLEELEEPPSEKSGGMHETRKGWSFGRADRERFKELERVAPALRGGRDAAADDQPSSSDTGSGAGETDQ